MGERKKKSGGWGEGGCDTVKRNDMVVEGRRWLRVDGHNDTPRSVFLVRNTWLTARKGWSREIWREGGGGWRVCCVMFTRRSGCAWFFIVRPGSSSSDEKKSYNNNHALGLIGEENSFFKRFHTKLVARQNTTPGQETALGFVYEL